MTGSPIRVVLFFGPYLRSAHEFALRLDAHPDIDLAAAWCEAPGETLPHRWSDLRRRRGWLAVPLLGFETVRDALRRLRGGAGERTHRRRWRRLRRRCVRYVPDLHAPAVVAEVRRFAPDLGLSYGGPLLRPELFRLPSRGTLGIHHGRLPEYRGKKTTFWEIWEGEARAGVTIQRIDEGIDTGEIVARGGVEIGRRGYERVWQEVQRLGLDLYVDAVLAVKDGRAEFRRPDAAPGPLRKDPGPEDLLRLPWRRVRRRLRGEGLEARRGR